MISSRRVFLGQSVLAAGGALNSNLLGAAIDPRAIDTASAGKIPTRDTVLKFFPDGRPRVFKGNTVICHLPEQALVQDEISLIRRDLISSSFAHKVAILPQESYHMTIYPGVNDQDREITGWPSYLPVNATIEQCDRAVAGRMKSFHLDCELPLRMKVDQEKTVANPRASSLRMIPADDSETQKLRRLRDRLVPVFGFRDKSHDTYGFHITLAYQLAPFSAREQAEHRAIFERRVSPVVAAAPILELGIPEFCTFQNMDRFDIQLLLST